MRFEKPKKKSGRPDFVAGRIAELERQIATLLNSIEKDATTAKGLLRHASVTTTQRHYIKHVPEVTLRAMEKVEVLCHDCAIPADDRPN